MTEPTEELVSLLRSEDLAGTAEWLSTAGPARRKAVRELVFDLDALRARGVVAHRSPAHGLAVLGTGRWADVKRIFVAFDPPQVPTVVRLLSALRPDWLDKWVAEHLDRSAPLAWRTCRALIRAGVAPVPADPGGYLRALTHFLGHTPIDQLLVELADDPEILSTEIWRLFELDYGGLHDFTWEQNRLAVNLAGLVERGLVERERLLEASVRVLTVGIDRRDVPGYLVLHHALRPSPAEYVRLQPLLLDLLRSSDGPIVGFALGALAEVDRDGALDDDAFAAQVSAVFSLKPMNHPKAALALLERVGRRRPTAVVEPLLAGLNHPAPQVQEKALDQLERHAVAVAAALRERIPFLVDSQRSRVEALLGEAPAASAPDPIGSGAEGLPEVWVRATRLDEVIAGRLVPSAVGGPEVPRVDASAAVVPVGGVDELVDELSLALTHPGALRFERALDGMSRLGGAIPAARLLPLLARAPEYPTTSTHELLRLIRAVTGELAPPQPALRWTGSSRVQEVVARLRERRPAPRIALPSDARGHLHPEEWVERLRAQSRSLDRHDRIAALLRLAPEGRAAARPHLDDDELAPERYAAGGPPPRAIPDEGLWSAARAARDPERPRYTLELALPHRHAEADLLRARLDGKVVPTIEEWAHQEDVAFDLMVHPAEPHRALAKGLARLDARRNATSNAFEPVAPFALPLSDPSVPWFEPGEAWSMPSLVAALALTSADPELRGRTVDATIGAIGDGRLADGALGRVLGLLGGFGRLKLNRVAVSLQEIGRVGALHRWVAADMAQELLVSLETPTPDLHHLLEALRELLVGADRPLDPRCAPILTPLAGKTKTGKLAQELGSRVGSAAPPQRVLAEAAAGRRERIEAWVRGQRPGAEPGR